MQNDETVEAAAQGDEDRAADLFRKSYANKFLSGPETTEAQAIRSRNTSSDNIVAMCSGALHHAGDEIFSPWTETHREWSGWMYEWWSFAVFCTIPEWHPFCAAWAAWHHLHLADFEQVAYTRFLGDREDTITRPRNYGLNGYRGRNSQPAASRCLWVLDAVPMVERNPGGRVDLGKGIVSNHPEIGWAGEIIQENIRAFDYGPPVEALNEIRLRKNQTFWLWHWPGGNLMSLAAKSTHHTRGPIGLVTFDAGTKVLQLVSPSKPTTAGQWSSVAGSVEGDRWRLESGGEVMTGTIPAGGELIIWDELGALHVGEEAPPVIEPPIPSPSPPVDQRVIKYLEEIEAQTYQVEPQAGPNHKPLQKIRNKAAESKRLLEL